MEEDSDEHKLQFPNRRNSPPSSTIMSASATVSTADNGNNNDEDPGQIELISESDNDFVVVSDDNKNPQDSDHTDDMSATFATADNGNNNDEDPGQIELMSESDNDFAVVSDDNKNGQDSDNSDHDMTVSPRNENVDSNNNNKDNADNSPSRSDQGNSMQSSFIYWYCLFFSYFFSLYEIFHFTLLNRKVIQMEKTAAILWKCLAKFFYNNEKCLSQKEEAAEKDEDSNCIKTYGYTQE